MKNRVAYPKEFRDEAKQKKQGLFTMSYVTSDGCSVTLQGLADDKRIKLMQELTGKLIK